MRLFHSIAFVLLATLCLGETAVAQLKLRVSVKFILNESGVRPGETGDPPDPNCESRDGSAISCNTEVLEKFVYANDVLDRLGRGYQFDVIEILDVTGLEQFFNGDDCETRTALEVLITASPERMQEFLWSADALNIYITNADAGGCSATRLPGSPAPLTMIAQNRTGGFVRPLHEMGHALGLCHTHGGEIEDGGCSICNGPDSDRHCVTMGDDCHSDTLLDNHGCDQADQLAMQNFGALYTDLSCAEQQLVLDVLYNVMSYHADNGHSSLCNFSSVPVPCGVVLPSQMCRHRLTADQLDRITDRANAFWPMIASGRTVFLSPTGNSCFLPFCPSGSSSDPFRLIQEAIDHADPQASDVMLFRGGSYHEPITFTRAVTLRASRGAAVIGPP